MGGLVYYGYLVDYQKINQRYWGIYIEFVIEWSTILRASSKLL